VRDTTALSLTAGRTPAVIRILVRARVLREYGALAALRHKVVAERFYRRSSGFTDHEYAAIWRDAASELEASVTDRGHGFLEVAGGGRSTWVWRQYTTLDDIVAFRRSLDKEVVQAVLAGAGLPIPAQVPYRASDLGPALAFLRSRRGPAVVKPADGTGGGMGVTAGVQSPKDLVLATALAGRYGQRLLIEDQATGTMYRLLFLDGQLLDTVRRLPARVVGDGRSSIRELIAAENRRRLAASGGNGFALLRVDLDCLLTLRASGRSMRSVPGVGEHVPVKVSSSDNRREDNETVRGPLDPGLVAQAAEATERLGLRLAGVDIVSPDPRRPPHENGTVIIEVNCTPGLAYHYHVRDRPIPVAVPVLARLLAPPS
jgi:D-alanine-D-alanine ligase-like ATP-grasp enzyme